MTRFNCTLQQREFSVVMSQRIPALTLRGLRRKPQPGDQLEITIARPDRSTESITVDILNARAWGESGEFIAALKLRNAGTPEPLTPAGWIMKAYHEKDIRKHNEDLTRSLARINRKAAIASYVHSVARQQHRK
ncbi:hypothetical protein CCF09_000078 [Escherichia coli]|nr:hypothetical protein [Escherichia coli]EFF1234750.1 hypothetical protein [Escherichia coli]EHY9875696.1 hypothetical protein [Escherichia coli]